MAIIIDIVMKRTLPTGVVCNSNRPIVLLGEVSPHDAIDKIEQELSVIRQAVSPKIFGPSQSDMIRQACDKLYPGKWAFVAQGGKVEF